MCHPSSLLHPQLVLTLRGLAFFWISTCLASLVAWLATPSSKSHLSSLAAHSDLCLQQETRSIRQPDWFRRSVNCFKISPSVEALIVEEPTEAQKLAFPCEDARDVSMLAILDVTHESS